MTDTLTPSDRRELRSLIKKQFQVLRAEVKRRQDEMKAEVEADLLRRYRQQDEAIDQARQEVNRLSEDYYRQVELVRQQVADAHPEMTVSVQQRFGGLSVQARDDNRSELHRAAVASIPTKVQDALTQLDQQELELLRELTVGAITSEEGRQFLDRIPTVGALVPTARLPQLEA